MSRKLPKISAKDARGTRLHYILPHVPICPFICSTDKIFSWRPVIFGGISSSNLPVFKFRFYRTYLRHLDKSPFHLGISVLTSWKFHRSSVEAGSFSGSTDRSLYRRFCVSFCFKFIIIKYFYIVLAFAFTC